ncbi:MAG: hypothetical protein QM731_04395 [Chitinophagaceae bacterium]
MMQSPSPASFELLAHTGFFGPKTKVTISPELISVHESGGFLQTIYWKDFDKIKYGAQGINGYSFYIGTRRKIFIRDINNNEILLNLPSIYNIKSKLKQQQFSQILDALYRHFLLSYIDKLLAETGEGKMLTIGNVTIGPHSISYAVNGKMYEVVINNIVLREYRGYFYIQDKTDPEKAVKVSFYEDWDAAILFAVVKTKMQ